MITAIRIYTEFITKYYFSLSFFYLLICIIIYYFSISIICYSGQSKRLIYHISEIINKININSPHSAVAIDCVNYYLNLEEYQWLEKFFSQNNLKK